MQHISWVVDLGNFSFLSITIQLSLTSGPICPRLIFLPKLSVISSFKFSCAFLVKGLSIFLSHWFLWVHQHIFDLQFYIWSCFMLQDLDSLFSMMCWLPFLSSWNLNLNLHHNYHSTHISMFSFRIQAYSSICSHIYMCWWVSCPIYDLLLSSSLWYF